MLLEPALIELRVIEAAKLWSQAAEGPNQSELTCDEIAHEIEPHFSRELQPVVSLALHLIEWVSACEEVRNHVT